MAWPSSQTGASTFAFGQFPAMPWRNGGGSTREVSTGSFTGSGPASEPWDWRLSVATISANGPFSFFAGIDRIAVLMSGSVALHGEGRRIAFNRVGDMRCFPGERALSAQIASTKGARLLNLMLRRDGATAQVRVHHGSTGEIPALNSGRRIFIAASGSFEVVDPSGAPSNYVSVEEGLDSPLPQVPCDVRMLSNEGCLIQLDILPPQQSAS